MTNEPLNQPPQTPNAPNLKSILLKAMDTHRLFDHMPEHGRVLAAEILVKEVERNGDG